MPVAVGYGVLCIVLLGWIACFVCNTLSIISVQAGKEYVPYFREMYCLSLSFLAVCIVVRLVLPRKSWQQRLRVLIMQLFLIGAFVLIFQLAFDFPNGKDSAFFVGKGDPDLGLVSLQEVVFIWMLFFVGAFFLCVMIGSEGRREEMNKVVGGILVIMGIMMPEWLKSWSLLIAYCGVKDCTLDQREVFVLFKMGIGYAGGLCAMFVVGLFSKLIVGFCRSCEEKLSAMSKGSSPDDSQNAEVPVPTSEITAASDEQNDGVELAPGSSSTATCVPQEAADGGAIPVQAAETLASASGSGVDLPKSWMSAAVSGLVAGACFSVVSRLFSRR